jgi:hypothetical protein
MRRAIRGNPTSSVSHFLAVLLVRALGAQVDAHTVQRPALAVGVHAKRHRHAAAERAEEQLVRCRTGAGAAERHGLVGEESGAGRR